MHGFCVRMRFVVPNESGIENAGVGLQKRRAIKRGATGFGAKERSRTASLDSIRVTMGWFAVAERVLCCNWHLALRNANHQTRSASERWQRALLLIASFLQPRPRFRCRFFGDDESHLTQNPCIVGPLGLKISGRARGQSITRWANDFGFCTSSSVWPTAISHPQMC